jgi:hypothetical protein
MIFFALIHIDRSQSKRPIGHCPYLFCCILDAVERVAKSMLGG